MEAAALYDTFQKYATDKGSHGYASFYGRHLPQNPSEVRAILELGVFKGSSIQAWMELFPDALVFGFDQDLTQYHYKPHDRIILIKGDQGNVEDLKGVLRKCNHFDLIIDDGSHEPAHQHLCLDTLFPSLNPGGLYVVEDLHAGTGCKTGLVKEPFYMRIGRMASGLCAWEDGSIGPAKIAEISVAPKIAAFRRAK